MPYAQFTKALHNMGYRFDAGVINCSNYGLAQDRKRFVLIASRYGEIKIPSGIKKNKKTVRQVIGKLPPLRDGEASLTDNLHKARSLSPLNLERAQHSLPGGTWLDWPEHLRLECHKTEAGGSFKSVYGRMRWDGRSPTITTQSYNIGTGRFIHPGQDRALSLREAAMLQSFPKGYKFTKGAEATSFTVVGRLIGNAVPPVLGKAIGKAFSDHVLESGAA
jgi:DNA (cytosine-5)-methyltransferase 1